MVWIHYYQTCSFTLYIQKLLVFATYVHSLMPHGRRIALCTLPTQPLDVTPSFTICHLQFTNCTFSILLFAICSLPFAVCHLQFAILQFAICSLPFAVCHLQFAILQFAICSLPFAVCHLQFAICSLPFCKLPFLQIVLLR